MAFSTVAETATLIFDQSLLGHEMDIVWHGGEPLTLSPEYYAEAIAIFEGQRPRTLAVHYGIQTNATLIDNAWIDFFEAHRVSVGISLDGPRDLHDRNRVSRSGSGTYDRVIQGIQKLQARGYPFHFIGVVTAQTLSKASEVVQHYWRFEPTAVGLNVEEIEAQNTRSSLYEYSGASFAQEKYERFIVQFLGEAARQVNKSIAIRDFQRTMSSLISGVPEDNDQVIPLRIVNITFDGHISTFSPELLALDPDERERFIFGNVHSCRALSDILRDDRFLAAYAAISRGVENCARTCDYFQYCGGGAPVNKLSEKGTLEAAETVFCSLTKKAWVNVCLRLANAPESRFDFGEGRVQ
jgi:uncharacterized protein